MALELSEEVHVSVATKERMSGVIRVVTTAVASRIGLNLDQADDLNTALDELFRFHISQECKTMPSEFRIRYNICKNCLEVVTEGIDDNFTDENSKIGRYCHFILEKMMDTVTEKPNPAGGIDIHIIKRISDG